MTVLEHTTIDYDVGFAQRPVIEPTGEQVRRYVDEVKHKHDWARHLGWMATQHPNIVLGEE